MYYVDPSPPNTHTHTHTPVSRQAREGDALLFVELNGKLSNQRIIQRPAALLTFLQTLMADSGFGLRDYSLPNEVRTHCSLVGSIVFLNCSPVWIALQFCKMI